MKNKVDRFVSFGADYIGCILFALLVCLVFAPLAHAQTALHVTQTQADPNGISLLQKIGIMAGIVVAVLQAIKKWFPAINGYAAIAVNLLLSLAVTYSTGTPVLSASFFIQAIIAALSASGVYHLVTAPKKPLQSS